MLRTRVISAVVGIPIILGILYCGGVYWKGLFVLIGILGLNEYHRMMVRAEFKPIIIPAYILLLTTMLLAWHTKIFEPLLFLILITATLGMIIRFPRVSFIDLALSLFAPLYLGYLLGYAVRTADLNNSFIIILLAFLLTWGSDIGGYFAGRFWGKHKLAPVLSPAKTWEGALGATLLPVAVALVFFPAIHMESINTAYVLLLGVSTGLLAQCGDLFESGMKRYFGVKDSGNIIPGHGGILDRFDSFLFVIPAVYYFFRIFNF